MTLTTMAALLISAQMTLTSMQNAQIAATHPAMPEKEAPVARETDIEYTEWHIIERAPAVQEEIKPDAPWYSTVSWVMQYARRGSIDR